MSLLLNLIIVLNRHWGAKYCYVSVFETSRRIRKEKTHCRQKINAPRRLRTTDLWYSWPVRYHNCHSECDWHHDSGRTNTLIASAAKTGGPVISTRCTNIPHFPQSVVCATERKADTQTSFPLDGHSFWHTACTLLHAFNTWRACIDFRHVVFSPAFFQYFVTVFVRFLSLCIRNVWRLFDLFSHNPFKLQRVLFICIASIQWRSFILRRQFGLVASFQNWVYPNIDFVSK